MLEIHSSRNIKTLSCQLLPLHLISPAINIFCKFFSLNFRKRVCFWLYLFDTSTPQCPHVRTKEGRKGARMSAPATKVGHSNIQISHANPCDACPSCKNIVHAKTNLTEGKSGPGLVQPADRFHFISSHTHVHMSNGKENTIPSHHITNFFPISAHILKYSKDR